MPLWSLVSNSARIWVLQAMCENLQRSEVPTGETSVQQPVCHETSARELRALLPNQSLLNLSLKPFPAVCETNYKLDEDMKAD